MIRIEERVLIGREAAEVYAFLTETGNFQKWQEGIVALEQLTPGPWRVGTRLRTVHSFLFWKGLEDFSEVTGLDPDLRIANAGRSGSNTYQEEFLLENASEGCRLTYRAGIETRGVFSLLKGLVGWAFRGQMRRSLVRLKAALEAERVIKNY